MFLMVVFAVAARGVAKIVDSKDWAAFQRRR
jgi:hypothetical protein